MTTLTKEIKGITFLTKKSKSFRTKFQKNEIQPKNVHYSTFLSNKKTNQKEKKAFMKNLFITDFKDISTKETQDQKVYFFNVDFYKKPLQLVIDKTTDTIALFQDGFVLENNRHVCQTILNKLS